MTVIKAKTLTCLTSLLVMSLILPSPAESACFTKPLSFDAAPSSGFQQPGLSVYCVHDGKKKQLFTAWIDIAACMRCFCAPSGLQCCGLGDVPGVIGCQRPQ